ncbi:MAG: arylsulfatase [Pirellula sp.]|nr:arylsulfatase [Pirellula sp.]
MPPVFHTLAILALIGAANVAADDAPTRPNIVVILCDDLGYGDVQVLNPQRGKIPTPNIDRLAADGMRFADAHSSCSVCTPSRYSLLTGRYAWRSRLQSGVLNGMSAPLLAPNQLTLATLLKQQGYDAACFGKWHLGLEFGADQFTSPIVDGPLQHGFDHFYGIAASLDMPPFAWIEDDHFPEAPTATKTFMRSGPSAPSFEAVDVLPTLTAKAIEFIKSHGDQTRNDANSDADQPQPYFLYLPLASPHTPLVPTPAWQGRSGLGEYADFVMQTDAAIGEILQAIDDAGQRDRTLVILTSDNGFAPYVKPEHLEQQGHYPSANFRGYKSDVWEGGHRIPFLVRWPGVVAANAESSQLIGQIDLVATVADLFDEPLPANAAVDSVSFLPILQGDDRPVRQHAIQQSADGYFAIRDGQWKLELCAGSGGWSEPREPQATKRKLSPDQLYDLAHDPGEQQNVAANNPEIVARLTQELKESIANGRTTPGPAQQNDVEIVIRKTAKPRR